MSAAPKRPKTINRLQRLITDWERDSGLPVRRLNYLNRKRISRASSTRRLNRVTSRCEL
jgi:hypothetical protein